MLQQPHLISSKAGRAAAVLATMAVTLSAGALAIWARRDLTRSDAFLFGDEGHNLWLAASLTSGRDLYADAATPYGPLSGGLYWLATAAASNTALTYQVLNVVMSAGSLVLLVLTLTRYGRAGWAAAWTVAALVPSLLAPGSLLGGLTVSSYVGAERLLICLCLWLWRPPDERSLARSMLLGATVGSMQWVRFGTGLLVLAGVFAADLADRRWRLRPALITASAAAAVAVLLAAWFLMTLPRPLALDQIWPIHLAASYDWVTVETRWPSAWTARLLVAQYAPPLIGVVLVVAAVFGGPSAPLRPAILLSTVFAAGAALMFWHAHHFRQFAWVLAAAGGLAAITLPTAWRRVALALVLPCAFVMGRGLLAAPRPHVMVPTPAAGDVYLTPGTAARVRALAVLKDDVGRTGGTLLVAPHGEGWHAAFDVPLPGRHGWFLGGAVRPWEHDEASARLQQAAVIVICPAAGLDSLKLPEAVAARLQAAFAEAGVLADCTLFARR